jgi:hypothetical protein
MPTAVRRLIIAVLLLIAGSAAFGLTRLNSSPSPPVDSIIESRNPQDGEKILQQAQITIDLLSGWDGKLTIDGIAIPRSQLRLVPQQNQVFFTPGEGKAIEELEAGDTCVTATIWKSSEGPGKDSQPVQWCFTVT